MEISSKLQLMALSSWVLCMPLMASARVEIINLSSGTIRLQANSCEVLQSNRAAICTWDTSISRSANSSHQRNERCQRVGSNKYQIDVSDCLPAFVKQYQAKPLFEHGANCWGTALALKNLTRKPRFVWSEEIKFWQSSTLCRKLSPQEKLEPGDILNVYGPEYLMENELDQEAYNPVGSRFIKALYPGRLQAVELNRSGYTGYHRLLHSETYISPQLAFGKESPNKLDRFVFSPLEEVYGRPRSSEAECQENQTLSPHLREYENQPRQIRRQKCAYFTNAYRCRDFSHLKKDDELMWLEKQNEIVFLQMTDPKARRLSMSEEQSVKSAALRIEKESLEELRSLDTTEENQQRMYLLVRKYFSAAALNHRF